MKKTILLLMLAIGVMGCNNDPTEVGVPGNNLRKANIQVYKRGTTSPASDVNVKLSNSGTLYQATSGSDGIARFSDIGKEYSSFSVQFEASCWGNSGNLTLDAPLNVGTVTATGEVDALGSILVHSNQDEAFYLYIDYVYQGTLSAYGSATINKLTVGSHYVQIKEVSYIFSQDVYPAYVEVGFCSTATVYL